MRIAFLASAHGFGHVTRCLALMETWRRQWPDDALTLFTAAPATLIDETLPGLPVVPWRADVGLLQPDALREDLPATVEAVEASLSPARIEALAAALAAVADAVVVDVAPQGMAAARRAGLPVVAVGNFDWAWIYSHYPLLQRFVDPFLDYQSEVRAVQVSPGAPLTGFREVVVVGGVGRTRAPYAWPEERGGVVPKVRPPVRVLVSFGGFGLEALTAVLPRIDAPRPVTWVLAPPMPPLDRPDARYVTGVPYPALVAAADVVLTKPGYGIWMEAALSGAPLLVLPRPHFPEAPYLEAALHARGDLLLPPLDALSPDALARALQQRLSAPRPAPQPSDNLRAARQIRAWLG